MTSHRFILKFARIIARCTAVTTLIWIVLLTARPAWAGPEEDVRALIEGGQYTQAFEISLQLENASGYILAAESLSTLILLGEIDDINSRSKEARELAKMALELAPQSYEARLQYVLNDGFVTRTTGEFKAWRKKLPAKTYQNISNFRADYPQDARAIALEAAWHLGIVRKTGESAGVKWFGASGTRGIELYAQAIQLEPNNLIIRTNYVMGMLALDTPPDMEYIKSQLVDILAIEAKNDVDRKLRIRAKHVHTAFDNPKDAVRLAERFLDGEA